MEVKELKNVDHSSTLCATIKSEVLAAVNEYLRSSLDDALYKHKALYHALIESILVDVDAMDKGVTDIQKKRKLDDSDRDEDPPTGPDQGLKRRKTEKILNNQRRPSQLEPPKAPLNRSQNLLASLHKQRRQCVTPLNGA
ncbi:hypothetical protein Tco_1458607 [Tanacetum coccineum]